MSCIFVLSNAGLITSIFSWRRSQTSCAGLFSSWIFFVNFVEMPQAYLGMLWIFASLVKVFVPILFATIFCVNASTPKRKRSHFLGDCSAAKSGETITFIFAFAKSFAVILPWSKGSTSEV